MAPPPGIDPDLDPATYRPRLLTRSRAGVLAGIAALCTALASWFYLARLRMPGHSHHGPLAALTTTERARVDALQRDITMLASTVGPRDAIHPRSLAAAADYIHREFSAANLAVVRLPYRTPEGGVFENIEATLPGVSRRDELVILGAHYDSADGVPGADDNASGVAALLSLARAMAAQPGQRTLRLVAFANEEPPYFQHEGMGSLVYARECRARGDHVRVMLSLESLGYYSDAADSQGYPFPFGLFLPDRGDFVAFVGDPDSARWVRRTIRAFRERDAMPSEGAIVDARTLGAGWSDHWSFWQVGYEAIMVTDTALLRNPNYHHQSDTLETLQLDRLSRTITGLEAVTRALIDGDLAR